MSGPRTDAARVVDECQQALASHNDSLENAQHLVKLLRLGRSAEDVAAVLLDKLCDGEAAAHEYLVALDESLQATFVVLRLCVALEARETKKSKGMK